MGLLHIVRYALLGELSASCLPQVELLTLTCSYRVVVQSHRAGHQRQLHPSLEPR
jgi:hypothetical protein